MFRKNTIRNTEPSAGNSHKTHTGFWFVIPLAAALLFASVLVAIPREPGNGILLLLLYAATTIVSAVLLTPLDPGFSWQSWRALLRRCATAATIFLAVTLIDPQTRVLSTQLVLPTTMLFLLTLAALTPILIVAGQRASARQIALSTIIALLFTPIWLGPLAEIGGNSTTLANLIAGLSPLSAIASSLDFDYLRSNWFYQYSVLGSLRYEYLTWPSYVLILMALIAGCSFSAADVKFNHMARSFRKRVTSS